MASHPTFCGPVAQLAEQQTLNLLVEGSIPSGLTIRLAFGSLMARAMSNCRERTDSQAVG